MTTIEVYVVTRQRAFSDEVLYEQACWEFKIVKDTHRVVLPRPGWRRRLRDG